MDPQVKQSMTRLHNVFGELTDLLTGEVLDQPVVNRALRLHMGEDAYQRLVAATLACDHASAGAEQFLKA